MLKTLFPFHFTKDKIKAEIEVSICQLCHPLHSSCTMNSVLQRTNPFRTFFAEQYVTFGATFHISRTLVCSQSAFHGKLLLRGLQRFSRPQKGVHFWFGTYVCTIEEILSCRILFIARQLSRFYWSSARLSLSKLHSAAKVLRAVLCTNLLWNWIWLKLWYEKQGFLGMNSSSLSFQDLRTTFAKCRIICILPLSLSF